jgi:hypothetical protein
MSNPAAAAFSDASARAPKNCHRLAKAALPDAQALASRAKAAGVMPK